MKKTFAREVLVALIVLVLSFVSFYSFDFVSNNIDQEITRLSETLPKKSSEKTSLFDVWKVFNRKSIFNGSFDEFVSEFGDYSKSELLFHLAYNNELFTRSIHDFRVKYYPKHQILKDSYDLYNRLTHYQNEISFEEFKSRIYSNREFAKINYEYFVSEGYKHSFDKYVKTFTEDNVIKNSLSDEVELNREEIRKLESSFVYKNRNRWDEIIITLIIVFYSVRILLVVIKWSLKQFK